MALFYRGAAVGTYWHSHDPQVSGFVPQVPTMNPSIDRLKEHVASGTVTSPFVSMTKSYSVAHDYATVGPRPASKSKPAFIWEIELEDLLPPGIKVIDPVKAIAQKLPLPTRAFGHHHNGRQNTLLGLISDAHSHLLSEPVLVPRGSNTPGPPHISKELKVLVFALRDAEVLVQGTIPADCIRHQYKVW